VVPSTNFGACDATSIAPARKPGKTVRGVYAAFQNVERKIVEAAEGSPRNEEQSGDAERRALED